ncbi:MAG: hypothetical protein ACQERB_10265 [Promethearchaeati archaeon]
MDKQRILKEAQQLASKYSFWMVSGDISHLYGYIYETPDKKFELEIKFPEQFPQKPPHIISDDDIKSYLGEPNLKGILQWRPENNVLNIVDELYEMLLNKLEPSKSQEKDMIQSPEHQDLSISKPEEINISSTPDIDETEEYITPDLNQYPPDDFIEPEAFTPSGDELFYDESPISPSPSHEPTQDQDEYIIPENAVTSPEELFISPDSTSLANKTELALLQQEYAYDQKTGNPANVVVYLTITLTRTFMINIDFSSYPEKPTISFPDEVTALIGNPYNSLESLKNWNSKNPPHIIDIFHELEKKLFTLKDIEEQLRKISQEFQIESDSRSLTMIKVHLLTYGFDEYVIDVDLEPYPNPPKIDISSELKDMIDKPIEEFNSIQIWTNNQSEPIEVIRELSWLVDKYSRINFELELLKVNYQNVSYDSTVDTLRVDMKGKMKTEDITFEFKIQLPRDYPMSIPKISVINEFELETHEKIREDLHHSFEDFFDEWTPYNYLVDLFNLISKKIFEVSVIACVICHDIECPTCSLKIAGEGETCHVACPYCDRVYHKHCWDQTIKSFGKCGFCLKVPPPNMMP